MWAITFQQLLCTVSCKNIFDLSNNFSQFYISIFVADREKKKLIKPFVPTVGLAQHDLLVFFMSQCFTSFSNSFSTSKNNTQLH